MPMGRGVKKVLPMGIIYSDKIGSPIDIPAQNGGVTAVNF